jgi:hypothetical protein
MARAPGPSVLTRLDGRVGAAAQGNIAGRLRDPESAYNPDHRAAYTALRRGRTGRRTISSGRAGRAARRHSAPAGRRANSTARLWGHDCR